MKPIDIADVVISWYVQDICTELKNSEWADMEGEKLDKRMLEILQKFEERILEQVRKIVKEEIEKYLKS